MPTGWPVPSSLASKCLVAVVALRAGVRPGKLTDLRAAADVLTAPAGAEPGEDITGNKDVLSRRSR
jgi:hypothetical protein